MPNPKYFKQCKKDVGVGTTYSRCKKWKKHKGNHDFSVGGWHD